MTLYLKHFGLREAPFKITPTTEFFYGGGRRGEILHALRYAVEVGEGIMMITGEVGSGKTMLLRTLSERLPENVELVYIANPSFSGREILYNICEELELDIDASRPDALRRLQNYLIDRHAKGKRVVAFIDEAQAMPDDSLEEIRLFSNLETGRHKLLQIALFGQPELLDKLSRQNMRQLRERITVALTLEPFGRDDIREYISTRLHAAGYNGGELFAKDGCHLLAVVSQGLSRRINVLADKAMLSAFERGRDRVVYEDVRRAVKDAKYGRMRYRSEEAQRFSRRLTAGLSVAACAVLALAVFSRFDDSDLPPGESAAVAAVAETPSLPAADSAPDNSPDNADLDNTNSDTAISDNAETIAPSAALPRTNPQSAARAETQTKPPQRNDAARAAESSVQNETPPVEIAAAEIEIKTVVKPAVKPEIKTEAVKPAAVQTAVQTNPQTKPQTESIVETQTSAAAESALLSVVVALQKGEAIDGEKIGAEVALFAESHTESPAAAGKGNGNDGWQSETIRKAGLVDNERWGWMPETSYLRLRLNATETWIAGEPGGYTARLLTVGQERSVFLERFLRYFGDFYPLRNLMVYPALLGERNKFVVTFGVYDTRDDVNVFIDNMPRYFTGGRPFAQAISDSATESSGRWQ
ncbi:MAG: AAA family ATPase [Gammaproteobacteria bacterium]